ncbi:SRPBCC domain-containing protein [Streptomyces sp. CAU 1734]|uniref:SRPBCC family protein n=1 Tax=Streptomyces sp. CAU 1734 TaxID=3140360 RepID=UPI00326016DA
MDHEVFVPVPAETLRQLLRDPARVARCLRGFQRDADDTAGPLAGRLKVRAGKHSITYRGALAVVERDGVFTVEGGGTETRGTGSVKVRLTVRPVAAEGGTALGFTGTAEAEGRLAELPDGAAVQAVHRLLDRFAERLAEVAIEQSPPPSADAGGAAAGTEGPGPVSSRDAERLGIVGAEGAEAGEGAGDAPVVPDSPEAEDISDGTLEDGPGAGDGTRADGADDADGADNADDADVAEELDVMEAEAEAEAEAEVQADAEAGDGAGRDTPKRTGLGGDDEEIDGFPVIDDQPPAEAAHARRTMIGRSAEEVDHAPPRGRYAPVPAPDDGSGAVPLRWIAPAAALAVAGAVVVGRVLRRRR